MQVTALFSQIAREAGLSEYHTSTGGYRYPSEVQRFSFGGEHIVIHTNYGQHGEEVYSVRSVYTGEDGERGYNTTPWKRKNALFGDAYEALSYANLGYAIEALQALANTKAIYDDREDQRARRAQAAKRKARKERAATRAFLRKYPRTWAA